MKKSYPVSLKKISYEELFKNKEYFSKGKRGYIYLSELNGKKYVIKTKNPASEKIGAIENEVIFNKLLNEINIGPKIYYFDEKKDYLIREFVDGKEIFEWIEEHKCNLNFRKNFLKIILNILEQCRRMDLTGINKLELTKPEKDILITKKNSPVIIDFERCKKTNNPKNVTQFCQFLSSGKMKFALLEQKIIFDEIELRNLSREYKIDLSKKVYDKITIQIKKILNT